jgi:hypothetical protein
MDRGAAISRSEYHELVLGEDGAEGVQTSPAVELLPSATHSQGELLSTEQMERLRRQQQSNMQLVLQAYLFEREYHDETSPYATHWRTQLNELHRQQYESDLMHGTHQPHFNRIVGLDAAVAVTRASPLVKTEEKPKRKRKKQSQETDIDEQYQLEYPKSIHEVLAGMMGVLDPILLPRVNKYASRKTRAVFTPAQDVLFTIGIYAFGDDWESIRAHLLPIWTSKQLMTHSSNLKSRRVPENPVKTYHLARIKPLTLEEEEILRKGVQLFGKKFRFLSQKLLKDRPALLLKQVWRKISAPT